MRQPDRDHSNYHNLFCIHNYDMSVNYVNTEPDLYEGRPLTAEVEGLQMEVHTYSAIIHVHVVGTYM